MLELAVYAIIAVVIISKLHNVLGKSPIIPRVVPEDTIEHQPQVVDIEAEKYPQFHSVIQNVVKKDDGFLLTNFLFGAEQAFEMIVNAVDNSKKEVLKSLLNDSVYKYFNDEIERRISKGEVYSTTVVSMRSKEIQNIECIKNNITIKIKFTSEQITIVKDISTNSVIRGDPSSTSLVEDIWSFQRNIKSSDLKWRLIAVN